MASYEEELDEEQLARQKKKKERPYRHLTMNVCDMPEEMREDAVEFAQEGLDNHKLHKDVAAHVKRQFDEKYKGTWHCIVGVHFGSNITHDANCMINFYLDKIAFLMFKNGPPEKPEGT
eukprot:NODE_2474_length_564_cov_36.672769_g2424_i0.p1 GENE.NODE_2474_length_564_cov_36.672769_g2424_i0~~NODE_2474_length_564_cov_36.672769_g2424_i0.p1  ORF type:complete len:119 (-),score=25.93 NODE_2474_length_564_cov_36.672769_g2424_i0:124-480(-)